MQNIGYLTLSAHLGHKGVSVVSISELLQNSLAVLAQPAAQGDR
jgi:hypothetical protein